MRGSKASRFVGLLSTQHSALAPPVCALLSLHFLCATHGVGLRRMCENVRIYARMKKLENAHVPAGERDSYTHDSLGPGLRRVGNAW